MDTNLKTETKKAENEQKPEDEKEFAKDQKPEDEKEPVRDHKPESDKKPADEKPLVEVKKPEREQAAVRDQKPENDKKPADEKPLVEIKKPEREQDPAKEIDLTKVQMPAIDLELAKVQVPAIEQASAKTQTPASKQKAAKRQTPAKKPKAAKEKKHRTQSVRVQLTEYFVVFAMVLMILLWAMQTLFLERYYENAMIRKTQAAVVSLSAQYSSLAFNLDTFLKTMSDLSSANDLYFYIEAEDGSFTMTSTDSGSSGRIYYGRRDVDRARELLLESTEDVLVYTITEEGSPSVTQVYATRLEGGLRPRVRLFAFAPLTPMGPAVSILAKQLVLATGISLVIAFILALNLSRIIADPIANITNRASELSKGHYNVVFEGSHFREINELSGTLNATAEALTRTEQLRRDLIANVSHDLRTPITMIRSYAEMIRDISGSDKKKRDEHLEVIIDESDRLSYLVQNILTLSRIQGGVEKMEMKPMDLQKAAERILTVYRVLEELEGYTIRLEDFPQALIVRADVRRIERVLSNLISNAVRYSAETKEVEIAFLQSGKWARCEVRDKGPGIPEEDLTNIWDRYEKSSAKGTRAKGGSGLGLSIAKEILERHGARYGVTSVLGEGSTFWFELPLID